MKKKWGSYKVLLHNKNYKVKILTLKPHSSTSVQRHKYRAEFWVRLDGDKKFSYKAVNCGEIHTLSNDTDRDMHVLEVQFGHKCVENDIERF
ncbi:MAG: phosphomannose isomerase type II C-terminal cupin domain, partial [Proteobacteria bacterium]|nr:phosphomannose isomerase type II C-terminal cupin domain [Pseudomonadota bacterium]